MSTYEKVPTEEVQEPVVDSKEPVIDTKEPVFPTQVPQINAYPGVAPTQPPPMYQPLKSFNHGVFDFDCTAKQCLLGTVFPCCALASSVNQLDEKINPYLCALSGVLHLFPCWMLAVRSRVRNHLALQVTSTTSVWGLILTIQGNFAEDCLLSVFCQPCSAVQIMQEVDDLTEAMHHMAVGGGVNMQAPTVQAPPAYSV